MSGIRLDRLLTSTAVLLFLTAAGGALADPQDAKTVGANAAGATQPDSAVTSPTAAAPATTISTDHRAVIRILLGSALRRIGPRDGRMHPPVSG